MSLSLGIKSLQKLVNVPAGAVPQADSLVEGMRQLEQGAVAVALEDLARLCRTAAGAVADVGGDSLAAHAEAVLAYVEQLTVYAASCADALAEGRDCTAITPPPVLSLANAEDEKHFLETLGMFITHAVGTVAELEEDILSLESTPEQAETIGGIRRIVHTLKAEFGVLNFTGAQKLCHETESAIDAVTEAGGQMPVDLLLEVADILKQYLDRLAKDARASFPDVTQLLDKLRVAATMPAPASSAAPSGDGGDAADAERVELAVGGEFADSLGEFVTEARSHLSDAESAMVAFAADPDGEHINVTFRAFHTIKGVAGFLNLTPLVELAHISETLLDEARSHRLTLQQNDVDLILASGDLITQMIHGLEGQPMPKKRQYSALVDQLRRAASRQEQPEAHEDDHDAEAPTQAKVQEHDDPSESAADGEHKATPADSGAVLRPAARAAEPAPKAAGEHGETKAAKVERTVKVNTARLDMLVDMVGELVIAQSMVLQDPTIQRLDSQMLSRNIGQVSKITRDLQEAAMSLRMVTVKATFQKMARLVRDVAHKSGKKVAFSMQGEDTELDRNVVEQISDPLVHMIRNAVDHGIEAPDDRRAAGKNSEGHLLLRAYHQGGSIVIEIQDDGRGIDKKRVAKKAVEKGLLPPDTDLNGMSDAEAFALIFLPGFSTAEKVTDLSGRGVGMDVVRRNIEALRGKIEIESRLGHGTVFRMRLPLTLAIIDGMVVRVGDERYVVPTLSIEQSFRPDAKDIHQLVDRGECVRVRGTVLPIYRLKRIFAQANGLDDLSQGILIVVEVDGANSCLFVDEILGQQQVVIKGLGVQGDRVPGVSGGAIMSDGRVALILDVGSLVDSAVGV